MRSAALHSAPNLWLCAGLESRNPQNQASGRYFLPATPAPECGTPGGGRRVHSRRRARPWAAGRCCVAVVAVESPDSPGGGIILQRRRHTQQGEGSGEAGFDPWSDFPPGSGEGGGSRGRPQGRTGHPGWRAWLGAMALGQRATSSPSPPSSAGLSPAPRGACLRNGPQKRVTLLDVGEARSQEPSSAKTRRQGGVQNTLGDGGPF